MGNATPISLGLSGAYANAGLTSVGVKVASASDNRQNLKWDEITNDLKTYFKYIYIDIKHI